MRLATLVHHGQRRVGRLSSDGTEVELFDIDGSRGALALIERGAAALPAIDGRVALASAALIAPLPQPRRNLWCVGRNYHAHARELRETVFKDNAADPQATSTAQDRPGRSSSPRCPKA